MMLLARLADFSAASASTVELEREVLETLQQVESDAFQRAAEVCLELAHERGAAIETFAGECAARLAEVACDDDDARLEDVASDATLHG